MLELRLLSTFKDGIKSPRYLAVIHDTSSTFNDVYRDNKLFFFEEYTDHGIEHVQDVLESAKAIIHQDSFCELSEEDIMVLILSIFLHDLGMHISFDGFKALLNGDFDDVRVDYFDEFTWKQLWEQYTIESKRFSDKQIRNIFGVDVEEGFAIKIPDLRNARKLDGDGRKLIGEFLRRHHARLAHEIALKGFPGKEITPFAEKLDEKLKDLLGLVARSHGMEVRTTFDYLKQRFQKSWKNFKDVKVIYLMTLLRISDLIQIHSGRASKMILKARSLSSPVAQMEWQAHQDIDDVNLKMDDPELINVHASPVTSKSFFKLQSLFKYIQYELDMSWAILGEVYSYHSNYKKLKIKYRRITSNIDDNREFSQTVNYVPEIIHFDAEPDLLKLLIKPLYGDDPSYGVRELIQNAVDACRERQYFLSIEFGGNSKEYKNYNPEIKVEVETESDGIHTFIITDNGIGMQKDTIKNYFLKAGASYRKSGAWQKKFTDEQGKSKVLRSGRFGIGVLASFLLGREISIVTRYMDPDLGYEFKTSINTDQIEMMKNTGCPVGTKIKITLSEHSYYLLKNPPRIPFFLWTKEGYAFHKWYRLDFPTISYYWEGKKLESNNNIPENFRNNPRYHIIKTKDFDEVAWSYDQSDLCCNGIVIPEGYSLDIKYFPYFKNIPFLNISDPQGKLPLSLDRKSLNENFPFDFDLIRDIAKDLLAYLLTLNNIPHWSNNKIFLEFCFIEHPVIKDSTDREKVDLSDDTGYIQIKKDGFWLEHIYNKLKIKVNSKILVYFKQKITLHEKIFTGSIDAISFRYSNSYYSDYDAFKHIKEIIYKDLQFTKKKFRLPKRYYLNKRVYNHFFDTRSQYLRKEFKEKAQQESISGNWVVISYNNAPETKINLECLENNYCDNLLLIEESFPPQKNKAEMEKTVKQRIDDGDVFLEVLQEYLGDLPVIPYDLNDRKEKFPKAFKDLEKYMLKYTESSQ